MIQYIETHLLSLAHILPLEIFIFVGSIIEEIIVPIPSATIIVFTGLVASLQERTVTSLCVLVAIGAFGKTVGGLIVYFIADKGEDFFMKKFGLFFKISHVEIEQFGTKFGKGFHDYILLTFLRALPIVPSALISVGSGVLKIHLPVFVVSTFLGTIVRDSFYLYAGFIGTEFFAYSVAKTNSVETWIEIIVGMVCVVYFIYFCKKKLVDNKRIQGGD